MSAYEEIAVRKLYQELKLRAEARKSKYSKLDFVLKVSEGIKIPHAKNILELYWYFVYQTDRPFYDRLKSVEDEGAMRQTVFGGKIQTAYVLGERHINVCSDMFPDEFLEIMDAYLELVDEKYLHAEIPVSSPRTAAAATAS